jgi:hypothetical protein
MATIPTAKEIISACHQAEQAGWTIKAGAFVNHGDMTCCPLTALSMKGLKPERLLRYQIVEQLTKKHGITIGWRTGFADSIDRHRRGDRGIGQHPRHFEDYREGYRLAEEVQKELHI